MSDAMNWSRTSAAPSSNQFLPRLDTLENRVVPDASSVLDPDFFNQLNFEAYDQANQRQQDTVRVISGIYQDGRQQEQEQEQEIQDAEGQVVDDAQQQIDTSSQQYQDYIQSLIDYKNQLENQYKDDVGDLQNKTQDAVSNLQNSGMDPQTVSQQTDVILLTTRMYYEQLTAKLDFQMQEVLTAYNWLNQQQQQQYTDIVNSAVAKYTQLQMVQQQLLNAYDTYNIQLLNYYEQQLNQIQQDLAAQLTGIQNAWIYQSQLVTQQQLQGLDNPPAAFDPDNDGDDDTGITY
jgi:hypothetical protein